MANKVRCLVNINSTNYLCDYAYYLVEIKSIVMTDIQQIKFKL